MSSACQVCGAPRVVAFAKVVDPQTREVFSIEACASCGLGHTTPQPDDLARYYGETYHGQRHGFTARHADRRRLKWIDAVFPDKAAKSVLDVGCGDGTFLVAARNRGWKVTGTEMNPDIARKEGLDVGTSLSDIAPRGPFDVITFWHTLEHMRDPKAMVLEARALLAPGGALFVAVPNAGGVQARFFGRHWFHLDVPRHLFHFTRTALENLVSTAGLKVVKRWDQEAEHGLFGWTQSALNTIVPEPNVLYALLTGRPTSPWKAAASVAAGSVVTAAAAPVEMTAMARGLGGTFIVAARA